MTCLRLTTAINEHAAIACNRSSHHHAPADGLQAIELGEQHLIAGDQHVEARQIRILRNLLNKSTVSDQNVKIKEKDRLTLPSNVFHSC